MVSYIGGKLAGRVPQLVDQSGQEACFLLRLGLQQLREGPDGLLLQEVQVVSAGLLQHAYVGRIPARAERCLSTCIMGKGARPGLDVREDYSMLPSRVLSHPERV